MNKSEELNRTVKALRTLSTENLGRWKEEGRKTHEMLKELADAGGADACELQNVQIAVRINLKRNVLYESTAEWKERRADLIDTFVNAVNENRDSQIWLRALMNSLTGREAKGIVDRLRMRQVNQNLFPALESEADFQPSEKLMQWYIAMLDRSQHFEEKGFNRLAYFYLWYGGYESDMARAKNYFLAMERRGIAAKNPYPGGFGEHGHEEMIRALLDDKLPEKGVQILVGYTKNQIRYVVEHGAPGDMECCYSDLGNVWFTWIENPHCNDLRECMRRICQVIEAPVAEETGYIEELMKAYGAGLKQLITTAEMTPGRPEFARGVTFMLAMLPHCDNWLLEIINQEAAGGKMLREKDAPEALKKKYYGSMEDWLAAIEPYCGGEFRIGEEMIVLTSLCENLIAYHEENGDEKKAFDLLQRLVYSTDALITLSGLGAEIGTEYYGMPYCTNQAMALIKKYVDKGNRTEMRRLIRGIQETEEKLTASCCDIMDESRLNALRSRFALLLKEIGWEDNTENEQPEWERDLCQEYYLAGDYAKALEVCTEENEERRLLLEYLTSGSIPEEAMMRGAQIVDRADENKVRNRLSFMGGCMIATQKSLSERMEFEYGLDDMARMFHEDCDGDRPSIGPRNAYCIQVSFPTAPPTLRGDFIRHIYSHPDGTDWFGRRRRE